MWQPEVVQITDIPVSAIQTCYDALLLHLDVKQFYGKLQMDSLWRRSTQLPLPTPVSAI